MLASIVVSFAMPCLHIDMKSVLVCSSSVSVTYCYNCNDKSGLIRE